DGTASVSSVVLPGRRRPGDRPASGGDAGPVRVGDRLAGEQRELNLGAFAVVEPAEQGDVDETRRHRLRVGELYPLERTERAQQVIPPDLGIGEGEAAVDLPRGIDQGIGIVLRAGGAR